MTLTDQKAINDFLNGETIPLFIGGKWKPAQSGKVIDVRQPGDGSKLGTVAAADASDVDAAVAAASAAFPAWARMRANERGVLLHRLADLIESNVDDLALLESLDVGKPIRDAKDFDIPFAAQAFRYYADLAVHVRSSEPIALSKIEARQIKVPYGPCGFIIPWNFPFLLLGWDIAPALAAGNTVVVKPAENTPLSTLFVCQLMQEAGFPEGVVNVVPGYGEVAGAALSTHPGLKRMSFTGSPEVGRLVAEAAGRNLIPCKLELGGKGAAVIFNDVDAIDAATKLAEGLTLNAGQVCCAATRWLIQRDIFDAFAQQAAEVLSAVKIGPGTEESSQMGPLVSEVQRERVLGYLKAGKQGGATALLEGDRVEVSGAADGYYVSPALLTGSNDNVCAREEIFGPVSYLMPFDDEDEAIALVNSSNYGLANSVWTEDLDRANRVAEQMVAGNSWINADGIFAYGLPYGGANLSGGGGGVNSEHTFFDYLRHQTIARPIE